MLHLQVCLDVMKDKNEASGGQVEDEEEVNLQSLSPPPLLGLCVRFAPSSACRLQFMLVSNEITGVRTPSAYLCLQC